MHKYRAIRGSIIAVNRTICFIHEISPQSL